MCDAKLCAKHFTCVTPLGPPNDRCHLCLADEGGEKHAKVARGMEGSAKTTSVTPAPEPEPRAHRPVRDLTLTCGKTAACTDACMHARTDGWVDNAWMHAWVRGRTHARGGMGGPPSLSMAVLMATWPACHDAP